MINKNPQQRIALKVREDNIKISQAKQEQNSKKSQIKSRRRSSGEFSYNRKSFYSKQKSHIPSLIEAKQRQKQIIKFHNRNFHQRQKRLQQIFKQNCRIYIQLNKQKSYYSKNFLKEDDRKSSKSHFVSCSDNTTKLFQHEKLQKFVQNSDLPSNKFKRRYSLSMVRSKKQREIQQKFNQLSAHNNVQSDVGIELKRYEKNKTEMLPRKYHKLNLQNTNQLSLFIENKSNRNSELSLVKNPVYIRFKRRPNSGFRG